jgi:hypothetical protein
MAEAFQHFGGTCCLHFQGTGMKTEAAGFFKILVNFYQTKK